MERPPKTKHQLNQLRNIMLNLSSTISERSMPLCVMIATIGSPVRMFDDEIISHLLQRCVNQPNALNHLSISILELLSRIIYYYPKSSDASIQLGHLLLEQIVNRLDQITMHTQYPIFMTIIRNLLAQNIYNVELLENIFRSDFLKMMNNSKQLEKTVYEIDGYAKINLKNIFIGHGLTDDYLQRLKYLVEYNPDQVNRFRHSERFIYEIENVIKKHFEYYQFAHGVAHHRYPGKLHE